MSETETVRAPMGLTPPLVTSSRSTEKRKLTPSDFKFGKMIGEGSFSTVCLGLEISTNREFAIKVCEKKQIIKEKKEKYIKREKEIMSRLTEQSKTRPFFVQLYSTFQDSLRLYFVMTYAKNGDLLRLIQQLPAKEVANPIEIVRFYASEILSAVEFMHEKGIIHRDLKPENILLSDKLHILITDFGSAIEVRPEGNGIPGGRRRRKTGDNRDVDSRVDTGVETETSDDANGPPKSKRQSFVGTPQYVSPEILHSRGSSRASDLWALGCIVYQLMTNEPPFQSPSEYIIFKKIEKLDYSFHEDFNLDVKDLIQKLLVLEPDQRLGAQDEVFYISIRSHPFFAGVDFDNLIEMTPPSVGILPLAHEGHNPIWNKIPDAEAGPNRIPYLFVRDDSSSSGEDTEDKFPPSTPKQSSSRSHSKHFKPIVDLLTDELKNTRISNQAKTNEYHQFVDGNLILKQGILYKKKGFRPRKRMFLLTEGPRMYYVDPDKMVLKGEIPWSNELSVEIRNFKDFFVHVPGRTYFLTDQESRAKDWCEALNEVRKFYYPEADEKILLIT